MGSYQFLTFVYLIYINIHYVVYIVIKFYEIIEIIYKLQNFVSSKVVKIGFKFKHISVQLSKLIISSSKLEL